jgi:hypothetical protein
MSESVAYYPGCSGLGTSKEYDASTRAVCQAVGLPLTDIPDWSCCGSAPAHTKDHMRRLRQKKARGTERAPGRRRPLRLLAPKRRATGNRFKP